MNKAKGKSRKLIIYESKEQGVLILNATEFKTNRYSMMNPTKNHGKILQAKTTNEELGKWVRKILNNCK